MANLHETTTIGGSIAITAKNIHEYLSNIVGGGDGGSLQMKELYYEDYMRDRGLSDLDHLSPISDVGIYITSGGITSPNKNLYGEIKLDPVVTKAYWDTKVAKLDVSNIINKSPMTDRSVLVVLNLDPSTSTKRLLLLCYHIQHKTWYRMESDVKSGILSKTWEVDVDIVRTFKNLSTVVDTIVSEDAKSLKKDNNLSDLSSVPQALRNLQIVLTDTVGGGDSKLYASQKLVKGVDDKVNTAVGDINDLSGRITKVETMSSTNKNRLDGTDTKISNLERDKIAGGDVVQSTGTSTTNVMSQKATTDALKAVNIPVDKIINKDSNNAVSSKAVYDFMVEMLFVIEGS